MRDACALRQVELNVRAGVAYHRLPQLRTLANETDRLMLTHTGTPDDQAFMMRLEELTALNLFAAWNYVRNHGLTALRGWRERVARCSMQVVEHRAAIEVDFDLFNPDFGLLPALGHIVEIAWPGKTDPFRVMAGLRNRGIPVKDARENA